MKEKKQIIRIMTRTNKIISRVCLTLLVSLLYFNLSYCQEDSTLLISPKNLIDKLAGDSSIYWNTKDSLKLPSWRIDRSGEILEYRYDNLINGKRIEYNYLDLVIGVLPFVLNRDTLILKNENTKFLVSEVTSEGFTIERISGNWGYTKSIFYKAKDQKTRILPFFSNSQSR